MTLQVSAVRGCVRAKLRHGAWGVVAIAVLIGLAGGAVLAAVAGARQTETAAPRLWKRAAVADIDLAVNAGFSSPDAPRVAKLPQVRDFSYLQGFLIGAGVAGGPAPSTVDPSKTVAFLASPDGRFGRTFNRFEKIPGFRGRMPDLDRADEVVASPTAASALGVRPGSQVHAVVATLDTSTFQVTATSPIDLTVVGIIVQPNELLTTSNQEAPIVLGTPAFARRFAGQVVFGAGEVELHDPNRDLKPFEAALHRAFPDVTFNVRPASRDLAIFDRAVRPYSDALRIFAAIAALAGLLVAAQALIRGVRADSVDHATLWAIGATRGQRGAIAMTRGLVAVVAGACLAVVVAIAASSLFPLGLARRVETDRGFAFDGAVLTPGFVAIVILLAAAVGLTAWLLSGRARQVDRSIAQPRSRTVERLAQAGAPPSAVIGVRFAYQRAGDGSSGSLATALFGLVAAITAIGAASTFADNLDRFVSTPARFGWTWSALIEGVNGFAPEQIDAIAQDRTLTGVTTGTRGAVSLGGQLVDTYGLKRVRGATGPVATKGRLPSAPDEVALGAQTLRDLHRSVGDSVVATASDGQSLRLRIVGRTLLPALSQATALGAEYGAVIPLETLYKLNRDSEGVVEFALVDLARGASLGDLRRRLGAERIAVSGPSQPGDIRSYQHVSSTPLLLVALLAVLGGGVLVHLLITSVRARRRDFAILKSIGFARRQVWATVGWQCASLVIAALAVGIPLGIAAGQRAWLGFASYLGANTQAAVPLVPFVVIPIATLAVAMAIAAFPARTAARTPTAVVLAAE